MFLLKRSNDDLLDQAWDGHTGEFSDAKKVKEVRKPEMVYCDKMHVFDKVLALLNAGRGQARRYLKARWVDIDKGTRYRSRLVASSIQRIADNSAS